MKEDRREYLAEWMQGMNPDTKSKLKLAKRNLATGTWYYIKEPLEGHNRHKWVALGTQDKATANRIFTEASSKLEYGDTELGTMINMNIAKLDRETRNRTWQDVQDSFCRDGLAPRTLATYKSNWYGHDDFMPIAKLKIIGTTTTQLVELYNQLGPCKQRHMRTIYNHASKRGWLITPNLVTMSDWQATQKSIGGNTASISADDHYAVIAEIEKWQEKWGQIGCPLLGGKVDKATHWMARACKHEHLQLKHFLEILWELGCSNMDGRQLTCDNINWDTGHVVFRRQKWSRNGKQDRLRQAIYFPMSQKLKDILRPLYQKAISQDEGKRYLLPDLVKKQSGNVTRTWQAYMKRAKRSLTHMDEDGIERKLCLHSYRYRMAEYLYELGYSEREAKLLMGHNSKEIHWAYAKSTRMEVMALDKKAAQMDKTNDIKVEPASKMVA